jgi:hypothetical protein
MIIHPVLIGSIYVLDMWMITIVRLMIYLTNTIPIPLVVDAVRPIA